MRGRVTIEFTWEMGKASEYMGEGEPPKSWQEAAEYDLAVLIDGVNTELTEVSTTYGPVEVIGDEPWPEDEP